jgi:hypothetical protein
MRIWTGCSRSSRRPLCICFPTKPRRDDDPATDIIAYYHFSARASPIIATGRGFGRPACAVST